MWVFAKTGFVSIVAHRDNPNHLLVRARVRQDLENFRETISPEVTHGIGDVIETPEADYRWRCTISRAAVADGLVHLALGMDYDNFKNAVHGEPARDRAYMDVWGAMYGLQRAGAGCCKGNAGCKSGGQTLLDLEGLG